MKVEPILDLYEVSSRYKRSAATIRRWYANGLMPSPRKASNSLGYGWPLSVLETWEQSVLETETERIQCH